MYVTILIFTLELCQFQNFRQGFRSYPSPSCREILFLSGNITAKTVNIHRHGSFIGKLRSSSRGQLKYMQRTAAIIPESTSPLPAVAIPELQKDSDTAFHSGQSLLYMRLSVPEHRHFSLHTDKHGLQGLPLVLIHPSRKDGLILMWGCENGLFPYEFHPLWMHCQNIQTICIQYNRLSCFCSVFQEPKHSFLS